MSIVGSTGSGLGGVGDHSGCIHQPLASIRIA